VGMKATAYCDGRGDATGTRGARAVVLKLPSGVVERAERLQPCTNIVAEHLAIQMALEVALEEGVTELLVYNDSQTPVHQVDGLYKVKQEHLIPLVQRTWELGQKFDSVQVRWVPREMTKRPDALCRQIDREKSGRTRPGGPVPEPVNPFLRQP